MPSQFISADSGKNGFFYFCIIEVLYHQVLDIRVGNIRYWLPNFLYLTVKYINTVYEFIAYNNAYFFRREYSGKISVSGIWYNVSSKCVAIPLFFYFILIHIQYKIK